MAARLRPTWLVVLLASIGSVGSVGSALALGLAPVGAPASVAAANRPDPHPGDRPPATETLPNGVRLVIQERPGCGTFALQLTALGGSAEDPLEYQGLSALLARMLLRGSVSIGADEQARRVEATGSVLDARSSAAGVALVAAGPAEAFGAVFDLVADAALHPKLAGVDLAKELALARQSLASARDNPSEALWRAALPLVFGSTHPLGRVVDDPATYGQAIDIETLRRAHDRRFVGRRLLVVMVGQVNPVAARSRARAAFGEWAAGDPAALPLAAPAPLQQERRAHARRRTSQPELLVALPTAGTADADAPALDLLRQILGGFQERLSYEIRERRGWAYWVEAWDLRHPGAGAFGLVTAVPKKRLAATEGLMRTELTRIASEPPAADEVERARRYLLTVRARAWQQSAERARSFTSDLIDGRSARDYEAIAGRYAAVTPEAIRDLAAGMFGSSKLAVVTLY